MASPFFLSLPHKLPLWSDAFDRYPVDICNFFWKYYQLDQLPGTGYLFRWPFEQWQLVAHVWIPLGSVRGTLLVWHGLFDHMAIYRQMIRLALQQNFQVVGLDLPGHGLSDGQRASIDDFSSYQRIVHGFFEVLRGWKAPQPWHALGQSTGSALLWEYLLQNQQEDKLAQVMLLAPLVRPAAFAQVRSSYRLLGRWMRSMPRKFRVNSSDNEFIRFTHRHDPLQPRWLDMRWVGAMLEWERRWRDSPLRCSREVQVIQGGKDETVDWVYNLAFLHRHFPSARILFLDEASHQLANESEPLRRPVEQRLEFMLRRTSTVQ